MKPRLHVWPGLDLRHLAAFRAVAETGSFARAAEQLGYTQPAVSQQVAALEQIVGRRLFDRASGRPLVELTAAGTSLVGHVEAVMSRLAAARGDLDALDDGTAVVLRIGALQTIAARVVPTLVGKVLASSPLARIDVRERAHDPSLLEDLERGLLDFAFAMLPLDGARFETLVLFDDPYCLVAPRTWGFASGVSSLRELDGVPMIGRRSCRCWDFVVSQFRAAGVEPNDVFRADDAFSVIGHVRSGVGVAVVSQLTVDMVRADDLDVTPLHDVMTPRSLVLAWSRERELSAVQERFLAVTRDYLDERKRAPHRRLIAASG